MSRTAKLLSRPSLPQVTEREHLEKALKRLDEFSRIALNSTNDAVSLIDVRDFRIAGVNSAFLKRVGLKKEEAIGKTCYALTHHRSKPCVAPDNPCPLPATVASGKHSVVEHVHYGVHGEEIYVEVFTSPVKDENGKVTHVVHIARDITDRKQMAEALQEKEEVYQDLLENANDLIQSVDSDGRFVYVNRAWRETLGYTRREISRLSLFDIIHPDSQAHCQEAFQHVMSGGTADRIEATFVTKDGRKIMVEGSANCRFVDGKPVASRGIFRNVTERKQAEKEIRCLLEKESKSAKEWQELFDASSDIIVLISPAFEILRINQVGCEGLGKKREELIGKKCYEVVHGLDAPIEGCPCVEVMKTKKAGSGEITQGGRSYIASASPIFDEDGEVKAFAHSIRDITERKQAEELYKTLTRSSPVGVYIVQEGKFVFVNPQFQEDAGYSEDELLGMDSLSIVLPEDRDTVRKNATSMLKDERSEHYEYRIVTKDGDITWILETVVSIQYQRRRATLGNFMNITERKQAVELYKTLTRSSPVGVYIVQEGKFVFVNPQFQEDTGYSEDELLGMDSLSIVLPEDRNAVRKNATSMLKDERSEHYEYRIVTKNGDITWILETVASIQYRGKRATLGNFMNITERKRAEQELMEKSKELAAASQAKSEFLASMSHELRTPLNAVIGFSDLMLDGIPGEINDEQKQCLSDILTSGQHLLNLINDVLDLSRVEAGRMELRLKSLNLADVIDDVQQAVRPLLDENKHRMKVSIEEGLPQVRADENRLRQIFFNLLSNAIKFTPPGGELSVEASKEGDYCQLSVTDNGIGIKKEDQERIFEVFTQVDTLPDGRTRGTGLGLALTRQLVEMIGGRIWVESEYGKGSRFTFTLPLATNG